MLVALQGFNFPVFIIGPVKLHDLGNAVDRDEQAQGQYSYLPHPHPSLLDPGKSLHEASAQARHQK
jgi:hypothetical protein